MQAWRHVMCRCADSLSMVTIQRVDHGQPAHINTAVSREPRRRIMNTEPVVETSAGKVRGRLERHVEDGQFFAFRGIPYAKPPVGSLRFRDPEPVESWSGVKNAFFVGSPCAQLEQMMFFVVGSDDCLYLNVYSKDLASDARKPVMCWIHGGAFVYGNGGDALYGPDYFMRKNVVLVTVNYRLGVFGFLNLEDEVAPGNQGLKDQVMALRWVRDNIANFGGDPSNVTLFGESAGAAAVHYLLLSPLTKGLYHKAIMQSGTIYNPWTHLTKNPKRFAYKMCKALGRKTTDSKEVVEFLRTIDCKKLVSIQEQMYEDQHKMLFPFGPGIDKGSKNPFMPIHMIEAADEGVHVPLLIGNNSREGIILFKNLTATYTKFNKDFEKELNPNAYDILNVYQMSPGQLRTLYCDSRDITLKNLEILIDLIGDLYFVEGVHRLLRTQVEKSSSPTYYYQFTFDRTSLLKQVFKLQASIDLKISGAAHMDELNYLFRSKLFESLTKKPLIRGSAEYKLMEQMVDMWVNFATFGNPTPLETNTLPVCWEPVSDSKTLKFLNINENLQMEITQNVGQKFSSQ